jgi:PIN domain nuclease of toxin-antitoxin system
VTGVLLDTNAFAWALQGPGSLSLVAQKAITAATTVYVSPISAFEITQKVRLGKWPDMVAVVPNLTTYLQVQGVTVMPLDVGVCAAAGSMNWSHKDPFDRLIAATALRLGCPLVSSDAAFDGVVAQFW